MAFCVVLIPLFEFLHCSTSVSWSAEGGKTHSNVAWAIQITEWNFNHLVLLITQPSDANIVRRWEGVTWRRWRRAERGQEERRERWIDYMRGRQGTGTALRSSDREQQNKYHTPKQWLCGLCHLTASAPLSFLNAVSLREGSFSQIRKHLQVKERKGLGEQERERHRRLHWHISTYCSNYQVAGFWQAKINPL